MAGLEYFAGIDGGSESHQVCIVDSAGTVLGERAFRHDGAGLAAMADRILATADVIGIAIEVPHGPVVETMMERGFALHSHKAGIAIVDRFLPRLHGTICAMPDTTHCRPNIPSAHVS